MPKVSKQQSRSGIPSLDWTGNDNLKTWELLTLLEQPENRKVLIGTKTGEKTIGERRIAACKRIGEALFPELAEQNASIIADRVKGKLAQMLRTYNQKVRALQATGNGILESNEDLSIDGKDSENFVGPDGPHENTPARQQNLWNQIISVFPFFPRLHRLCCTRPNSTPPAITTGVGPEGRHVVYLQPLHNGFRKQDDREDFNTTSIQVLDPTLSQCQDSVSTNIPQAPCSPLSFSTGSHSQVISPSPLSNRNLNLIANIATALPPLSSFDSSESLHSSIDSPTAASSNNSGHSSTNLSSFAHSSFSSNLNSSSSRSFNSQINSPSSSQSTGSGSTTISTLDGKARISAAMASARARISSFPAHSKRQSVEDSFAEYTNKTLELIHARISSEEAQTQARLKQQKIEFRESRYQSLLRQQEIFERRQQTTLRELELGLLSQDDYRKRVAIINKRADKIADALMEFESSNLSDSSYDLDMQLS